MSEVTDPSLEAEQPGLAAAPRASKRVYLMPPARWKSGRSVAQVQATDWSTIVQAPSAWSPKWVKPSTTPEPVLSRLKWTAIRPEAASCVAGLRVIARQARVSGNVAHVARNLRNRALRETSAVWNHTHRRGAVAAFSCCIIFGVGAISLLTGVAHSEPKIDTLPDHDAIRSAPDAFRHLQAPVLGSPIDQAAARYPDIMLYEQGAERTSGAEPNALFAFKHLREPAADRRASRLIDLTLPAIAGTGQYGVRLEPMSNVGTVSSVQSVAANLRVPEPGLTAAPDATIDPINAVAMPIAIDKPSVSSTPRIAELILPVVMDLPSNTPPPKRSRAVVAMTLISDVSTMDLMMPIAEPDLDIASRESVWAQVGRQFSIDPLLLYSIALVESKSLHPGGQVAPTPWMFRVSDRLVTGERHHVQMQIAMAGQLNSAVQDVGIMQVYYPMHRNAARDPLTLLDPRTNITVAAKILQDGMHRTRDPVMGIGYYHSGTPSLALNYGTAVMIVYQRLKGVYRQGRNSQLAARPAARAPLRLASGVNEQPAHISKAKAGF